MKNKYGYKVCYREFGKTKMNALLRSGEFPAVKIGGQYRITKEELEKWMEQNKGKEIYL